MSSQVFSEHLSCPGKMSGCKYPCCTFCSKQRMFLMTHFCHYPPFSNLSPRFPCCLLTFIPRPWWQKSCYLLFKDFTNCSPFPSRERESSSSAETEGSSCINPSGGLYRCLNHSLKKKKKNSVLLLEPKTRTRSHSGNSLPSL